MPSRTLSIAILALFALAPSAGADEPAAAAAVLRVRADQPGARISPTLFGVFFEDINLGADGGLVAELVKNRSFEFPEPLTGWSKVPREDADVTLSVGDRDPAARANPRYVRVTVGAAGKGLGIVNEGFRGIGVRAGEDYRFSVKARGTVGTLRVSLEAPDGQTLARAEVPGVGEDWSTFQAVLRPGSTEAKARLRIAADTAGSFEVDTVSVVPEHTWMGRHPGLRADLVRLLDDLRPGFVRFPGGCVVEGRRLATRYQWKDTIGPPDERPLLINRWNDEYAHRPAPDYFQSFGLGFLEYFQLCEDLGAEPLPIVNCGMACQFNSGELATLEETDAYVQDALDLVEFATGPASSPWGQRRAALGHPGPFRLNYLGIGNEQWGPAYFERYERFAKALKAKHPRIQLISSAGPRPDDARFDDAWARLRALGADLVDEHCYDRPRWFLDAATRYDHYPRAGPKVFMGEYAAHGDRAGSPQGRNTWECALAEAAFMTGLERNADVVVMSSYAPLFAHADGWQWTPDLIWFDNLRSFGTPSYHVQRLFGRNRGDRVLPVAIDAAEKPPLYASASRHEASGEIVLKVVNAGARPVEARLETTAPDPLGAEATAWLLAGEPADVNSFEQPRRIAPRERTITGVSARFTHEFPAHSLTVLRLKTRD